MILIDHFTWIQADVKLLIIRKGSDINIVDTYLKEKSKSIGPIGPGWSIKIRLFFSVVCFGVENLLDL